MDEEEEEEEEDVGSMLSSLSGEEDEGSSNSVGSSSSDFVEDATSSSGSSSSNSIGSDDDHPGGGAGPLFEMSSLISHLPFKRWLSKHFQGKSQSFTSLADVRSLEDLVKPERPFRKKLKSSRSYAGGLDSHKGCCSRAISKKGSRGRFSSLSSKRHQHSFLGSRPPVPPHRSGSFSLHAVAYSPQNISSSVLGDDVQRCSNSSGKVRCLGDYIKVS